MTLALVALIAIVYKASYIETQCTAPEGQSRGDLSKNSGHAVIISGRYIPVVAEYAFAGAPQLSVRISMDTNISVRLFKHSSLWC